MNGLYKDKYEILKTFKDNEYQTVLIGSNKENPVEVVVINILHKNKMSKVISKSQFPNGLHGLLHLEDIEDDLVVVTEYREGTPLESYLKFFDTTIKHKFNLAYEYMSKIVKYDIFHNSIKKILIDESQIIIQNKELSFNELLFLDDGFGESTEFNVITSTIGKTIEKIIFSKDPIDDKDNDHTSQSILKLINKLKNNDHEFKNIEDVYNAFRKIYIYGIFMEDEYRLGNDEAAQVKDDSLSKESIDTKAIGYNEITESEENVENNDYMKDAVEKLETDKAHEDSLHYDLDDSESLPKEEEDPYADLDKFFIGNKQLIGNPQNHKERRKKRGSYIPIAIGILLLAALLYGAFALSKPLLKSFKSNSTEEISKPEAYFICQKIADSYHVTNESKVYGKDNEIVETSWKIYKGDELMREIDNKKSLEIRFENEGSYTVVLNIKDKYGNIDDYREEIIYNNKIEIDELETNSNSEEKLDNLNLSYSSTTAKDYEAFRGGNYSLRLGKEGKANSEIIIIDNLDVENKPIISMWIAASSKENIDVLIKGYSSDILQFSETIPFIPKETNTWEMIEISPTAKNIDKIELIFKDFNSPIWLDDIQVSQYK